jgi:hypothetical protein
MRKKKPIKLITLDTETYNGLIGSLKRIAIYDGKNVTYGYSFLDVEPILLEYEKQGFNVHVYIHNLEFDARKIPQLFEDNRIIWEKCFIINNKLATITTKKYIIHDSFKLLPMSLAKLSKDFGVEHGKMDLWDEVQKTYPNEYTDIVDFLDRCHVDDPVYLKYLGFDVISLYEIIEILLEVSGVPLDQFVKKISTASLSRYIFKTGYKGKEFKNPFGNKTDYERLCSYKWHFDLETEEFIRCSYCGGRTEVFKPELISKGYHYDVNSLYPFVMLREYPIGKPTMYSIPEVAKEMFENWMNDHLGLGFVSCSVYIPEQHIPPLPVKMGKLVFPTGHVYGTFTYHELEYAIKNCGVVITEFREVCHFDQTYPIFKNFIETMYEIKEEGTRTHNEALRTFGKLLMNVGYGYTGMTRDKTKLEPISKLEKYLASGDPIVYINEELGYIEIPANVTSEYIQVQVASYVTSYARLILLDALKMAEKLGEVYYCDTDSIVCSEPLPDFMVDGVKLSMWDLESEPLKALYLKPKVYSEVLENKTNIKFKGISKETQKNLTFDDYEMLLEELETKKNDYVLVEKNKLMMRSIMYLEKTGADLNSYEYRDKKMNIKTIEKRNMDYKNNFTSPLHFESEQAFETFSFNPKRTFNINSI